MLSARNGEAGGQGEYEQSPALPPKSGLSPDDLRVQKLPRTLENDQEIKKSVQQMFDEEILQGVVSLSMTLLMMFSFEATSFG